MRFGFVSSRILEALEQAAEPAQGKKRELTEEIDIGGRAKKKLCKLVNNGN